MERRFFRSTSTEHLQAELRQYELLREAEERGRVTSRFDRRDPESAWRRPGVGHGLQLLVRRLAG